ncbi:Protein-arginine deiminase type-1 [Tolypocladium ophioglossoides CBS 100239]|uniref:Protein-arginine deiminase type-1 n=1 Tax=Tolypocladium ophioglossoides (strain CBS 100239) TaxID=1163406 RepID=A0A0L0NHW6_TOLOC|nr:Protein-arginine deiminase type-1 [Tolypocladium ophioglossoides CBS 100239]
MKLSIVSQNLVLGLLSCRSGSAWKADIRADSNRDGLIDIKGDGDLQDKLEWSDKAGAIFLSNIGDTDRRCSKIALAGPPPSDEALAACNDASDDIQRSPRYMAPLMTVPIPSLGDGAWGYVRIFQEIARKNARIFRQEPSGWVLTTNDYRFSANRLREGLHLGIDARDTRRPSGWDGRAEIHFDVQNGLEESHDVVRLRVAPLLAYHHLMPVSEVLATNGNESMTPCQARFVSDLRDILDRPSINKPLWLFNHSDDVWAQDFVEPGYTSMPGPSGPITLQVMIRSSQGSRIAGRQVFEYLRKTGRGAVYSTGGTRDEVDSTGNLETIPPYEYNGNHFPAGRVIDGSHNESYPSFPHIHDYMRAQELQSPLILDTDWLAVGHVDEMVQFLPAAGTQHGWALYIADPMGGIEILQQAIKDGHGNEPAFSRPNGTIPRIAGDVPGISINEMLTDKLIADNERFAKRVDAVQAVLQRETGIKNDEIYQVPMIFTTGVCWDEAEEVSPERNCSTKHAAALYPGVLNGVVLSDSKYLSPNPWGPIINKVDVMKVATDNVYGQAGFEVIYIDDWYSHHEGGGEVHCGTNTIRDPTRPWWDVKSPPRTGEDGGRIEL